ncbi:MAG: endonuclease/exonuclease/phosphatase family protein, partial [Bacteroidales bacterium]|nr:endonuclease/exonuclease/phosphatase family protein [Bacteroidales bacterium]
DGLISLPEDGYGFGYFPGQYGFALLSKYKINVEDIRTFQNFLWKDMPGAKLPKNEDGSSYYSDEALAVFRLSSKNHVDIPIEFPNKKVVHFIIAHPTPPGFDGPEDKNGTRNHDEIRFLNDYVRNKDYIYDDKGNKGGIGDTDYFVIMGDMNADPCDGDATDDPISLFKANDRINQHVLTGSATPTSLNGDIAAHEQGGANNLHKGNPMFDTGDFDDDNPGNLRTDYVLPSVDVTIVKSKVFWPTKSDSHYHLNEASDHKMVWLDSAI